MEQTNRTILFETINPEIVNLLTLVSDSTLESLNDHSLQIINDELQVSSFQECLNKFKPALYLYINSVTRQVWCSDYLGSC